MQRTLDASASSVKIRTRARGVLAKLAHDLELEARGATGTVEVVGERWTAELSFPVAGLRVLGVVRNGRVLVDVLSASDVAQIEKKIRTEVLVGPCVTVTGQGSKLLGELRIAAPHGTQGLPIALSLEERADGATLVHARTRLSLARLGCPEVKAPLGAFKVADELEVDAALLVRG